MNQPTTCDGHDASDHRLILKIFQYLEGEPQQRRSVNEVLQALSVSPHYLQHTIERWAGVRPKHYFQHFAPKPPHQLLLERIEVLKPSQDRVLTLPGRQRDRIVTWKAMTPEQYAIQFGELMAGYVRYRSPFGEMLSYGTKQGLCGMCFDQLVDRETAQADIAKRLPKFGHRQGGEEIKSWTRAAFEGGEVRLLLIGTPFQTKVWEALLAIPSGQERCYEAVAREIDPPSVARAVG